ncbi:DNA/RNA non-specific endonuclease [Streptomyces sp. NBC_00320]|uniref:DNA/RNA non-specific endonuclease n=1 Tax=Streptomyces sp. NBC_00320 TaxID=2975711 RepID=UPI00224D749C|nr:DNA/RNA non-specific endonuclease [Streptomyces sp. NBC_00320]MCX5152385.1 DNA/RNA non-specific endonuclease [Streptomyces sp. NBC_00320]
MRRRRTWRRALAPCPTAPGTPNRSSARWYRFETVVLPYTHFTVVHRPGRRLAASTAVCIDGAKLLEDVPRDDAWEFDPQLPESQQAGNDIYRNNPLYRGHLVRRLDPVWGSTAEANRANTDTFHFTNAAPQQDTFNQGKQLWHGLESHLLDHAAEFDRKLTIMTGPVLHDSDPPYRGIQVPLRFWKVAAFIQSGQLASTVHPGPEPRPHPRLRAGDSGRQARRPAAARPVPHFPGAGRRHRAAHRSGLRPAPGCGPHARHPGARGALEAA